MTARSYHRGHPIEWIKGRWQYFVGPQTGKYGSERPCAHCHGVSKQHDICLGRLPGVQAACCGHGRVEEAYFIFHDGTQLREADAVFLRQVWVDHPVTPEVAIKVYLLVRDLPETQRLCNLADWGYSLGDVLDAAENSAKSA